MVRKQGDTVRPSHYAFVFLVLLGVGLSGIRSVGGRVLETPRPAPAFTGVAAQDWINSGPLRLEDLRGEVVLVDFWTFDCWNCYRSFPWLKDLEARLGPKGLRVVGIHSPEFDHERRRENVVTKVREFGLHHPVMLDNGFEYWRAMGNRYWPTFYVIDKKARIRGVFAGETHEGDRNAAGVEDLIRKLLAEP